MVEFSFLGLEAFMVWGIQTVEVQGGLQIVVRGFLMRLGALYDVEVCLWNLL